MISRHQLDRLRGILAAAVRVPQEERAAFIRAECSDDESLRAEVEALLEVHESAGSFLSHSLPELLGAESPAEAELAAGTLLKERYRIERRIAQSSFASVYLASDELLAGMRVVVKRLDQLADVAALQEMFASELQALSRVRHPNVVGMSDIGTLDDGVPFLVLEYVPGPTLREVLRAGPVPSSRARAILLGIGRALRAAHKAEVWHLDLKPENVIVSEPASSDERIKLIDFGIARLKSFGGERQSAGSPNYMAPEQGENPSALCDIYALALVAFELLAGHLPRRDLELEEQLPRWVPARAVRAIGKGLASASSERFADVSQFVDELTAEPAKRRVGIYAAAAITAAIGMVAYFAFARFGASASRHEYSKPIQLVVSPLIEQQLEISPDGREIYYSAGEGGRLGIYKKPVAGGDPVQVVGGLADHTVPRVSLDGRRIVFIRRGAKTEIVQKELDGGQEKVLSRGVEWETFSLAANGKRLVLSAIPNRFQKLQILDVETKEVKVLEVPGSPDCGQYHPSLSPDGKFLAFACRWAQGSDDLFVSAVNGDVKPVGMARRLTNRKDRIRSVAWAPDSKSLLYVGGPLDSGSVWRVDSHGMDAPVQVSDIPAQVENIAVAREAWSAVYVRDRSVTNLWQAPLSGALAPHPLVASSHGDGEGRISPDGRMLLFGSGRSGSGQQWVANANGTSARQLTAFEGADVVTGMWTADSKEAIISVRSKDIGERVYRAAVQGTPTMTRLLDGGMATGVSQDGRWIYVTKATGAQRSIWRTELGESVTTKLIAKGGVFGQEAVDGRSYCFAKSDEAQGVWCHALPEGATSRVIERLYRRNLFALGRTGIYYVGPSPGEGHPSLFFQSFQSEAPKVLRRFQQYVGWGLSVSPDERSVVFSQVDVGNSEIMLIERFR